MNPEKIKNEFLRIRNLGFIPNTRSDTNDGSAGNVFEDHLGVSENNLREPDFEGFEVKTKKYLQSSSYISLFTTKPSSPPNGDGYMRSNWGIPDRCVPSVKCFRTSLYGHRWSLVYGTHQMRIDVDKTNKKVFINRSDLNFNPIDTNVFWTFNDIQSGSVKLKNLFLVGVEVKKINGKDHFKYIDAIVYTDYLGDTNFINLIEDGTVRYDNRLGVYGPNVADVRLRGTPHNHGGGFRVSRKNLDKLYKNKIVIPKE